VAELDAGGNSSMVAGLVARSSHTRTELLTKRRPGNSGDEIPKP